MSSWREFELDYEIDSIGPNGIRKVELWGSNDGGQNWTLWKLDQDRTSPCQVNVPQDGTYGFKVIVVGNNGLAGQAPQNGDLADLWVTVDTNRPVVQLTNALYGEGAHVGQLELRWNASDDWFGARPITLYFADNPSGPWTTIASGLPNTGQYYWAIDPRVPSQIYLRVEAFDQAGNLSHHQLEKPISVAGLTPKARIRGIRPLSAGGQAAPRR